MTDDKKNITWKPGWYADRLHAKVGERIFYAACGFHFPHILPDAEWFKRKLDKGVPKCKKCLAALEKSGHIETAQPKRCRWVLSEDFCWETSCGKFYLLTITEDSSPGKNGMKYCPYCGGELVTDKTKGE